MSTNLTITIPDRVVKTWKIKSRTQVYPDTGEPIEYFVDLLTSGKYRCSCSSYRKCWHIKEKQNEYEKQYKTK